MRRHFGAAVVEATGAVAAGFIEAAAVQVLSADQEAAARFGDRWAAAQHEDRPVELLCVGRWAVALP
jgi:hypothetical protein